MSDFLTQINPSENPLGDMDLSKIAFVKFTNPGDYIFWLDYGAGLPQYIGQLADIPKITALIRGQILLEDSVAKTPAPVVNVKAINGGVSGGFSVEISYTDASTGEQTSLNFNVSK